MRNRLFCECHACYQRCLTCYHVSFRKGLFFPFISSVPNVHGILTENPTWLKNCSILSYGKELLHVKSNTCDAVTFNLKGVNYEKTSEEMIDNYPWYFEIR